MGERRWRAPVALFAGAVVLVAAVVVTGRDAPDISAAGTGLLPPASPPWCPQSSVTETGDDRFALDGRVVGVRDGAVGSILSLEVVTWYLGPPVGQVDIEVTGAGDPGPAPGDRLLVQGAWDADGGPPVVDSCRARTWTAALGRAWEGSAAAGEPVAGQAVLPGDPVARYDSVGFRRAGPGGGPALTGVLVRELGCVYVADGRTRWLPVFPSGQVGWDPAGETVLLGGTSLVVGQEVRLGGSPERGPQAGPGVPGAPEEVDGPAVDVGGLPPGCDLEVPRFVVGESDTGPWATERLSTGDPYVRAVREAARAAGLEPSVVDGRLELDQFGGQTLRFLVSATTGPLGQDVAVSIGTVQPEAWPQALDTVDATVRSTADGPVRGLPAAAAGGSEVVSVERAGRTTVMVRTPGLMVVTVSVPLPADDARVATMAALAGAVATGDGQR